MLGDLWPDYHRFCQVPSELGDSEFHFCRRFGVAAKVLRGNRWVLQMLISTATVDKRTLENYYRRGEVASLAAMIEAKQANRLNRRSRAVAGRVLKEGRHSRPLPTQSQKDASTSSGGQHNNRAMACLGYGFARPHDMLCFRPEEIPIDVQKAESIPTNCLAVLVHLLPL